MTVPGVKVRWGQYTKEIGYYPDCGAGVLRLPRADRPLAGRPQGPHPAGDRRAEEGAAGLPRVRHRQGRAERGRGAEARGGATSADVRRGPAAAGFGPAGVEADARHGIRDTRGKPDLVTRLRLVSSC